MSNPKIEITEQWKVPFTELKNWMKIAGGNFGKIYLCEYQGKEVAVKLLLSPDEDDEEDSMEIYYQREMATLKELDHPNILKLLGLCTYENRLFIITEYVKGGDLRKLLKNRSKELSWDLRVSMALDMAKALEYLHSKNIIHRDMKSKNLLVTDDLHLKACDFGFARKITIEGEGMTLCGSDQWMAPEVMLGQNYDEKGSSF